MTLTDTETVALVAVAEAGRMDAQQFIAEYGGMIFFLLMEEDLIEQAGNDVVLGPKAPGLEKE